MPGSARARLAAAAAAAARRPAAAASLDGSRRTLAPTPAALLGTAPALRGPAAGPVAVLESRGAWSEGGAGAGAAAASAPRALAPPRKPTGAAARTGNAAGALPRRPGLPAARLHSWAAAGALAPKPFKLTDIGEGIVQVELTKWHVKPGDAVKEFDVLCEVQSDKATVEISSRYAGVIRSLGAKEGDVVKVGAVLVEFEDAGAGAGAGAGVGAGPPPPAGAAPKVAAPAAAASSPVAAPAPAPTPPSLGPYSDKVEATPAVRHLAKENNIDLSKIRGTGRGGRVTKEDVLNALGMIPPSSSSAPPPAPSPAPASAPQRPPPPPLAGAPAAAAARTASPAAAAGARPAAAPSTAPPPAPPPQAASSDPTYRVPMRGIRREMGKVMTASLRIPHLNLMEDVQMDQAEALVKPLKARGVTTLALLVKAASLALQDFPELNALAADADATELVVHRSHSIGVAMDTPRGLIVPVVSAVESRSVLEVAAELARLRGLAAEGKLGPAELQQPTFSLSNIGSIGGAYASPVIAPPQVAMGVLGRARRVPVFTPEPDSLTVVAAKLMPVTWAADHRVIDGATVARFSNRFKALVEQPGEMLARLR